MTIMKTLIPTLFSSFLNAAATKNWPSVFI